jgi:hypothetical protein
MTSHQPKRNPEVANYRHALEIIAYHEPCTDDLAENMRQIARGSLGWGTQGSGTTDWKQALIEQHVTTGGTDHEPYEATT